ncbi:MAG: DNA starvation/stationary phase protection protein Dps [Hyphomicrobiaceae bacterium]
MSNRNAKFNVVNSLQMLETKNTLALDSRYASIEALNNIVAHMIDVALAAKHAHWNVRGPSFMSYHTLFDKAFTDLIEQIDSLGERATALGGIARGTVQTVAAATRFAPYPVLSTAEAEHVALLSTRLGELGHDLRQATIAASEHGDIVTADVLTDAGAAVDSLLWLIESHTART